jgi:hypothetical protein
MTELLEQLTQNLGINEDQAKGGAGLPASWRRISWDPEILARYPKRCLE